MQEFQPEQLSIIDSHTGGEPTRLVLKGLPDLGNCSLTEQRRMLRERYDYLRTGLINEPRGSEVLVGAYLLAPLTPGALCGVIFFNNVGYLSMCGHGTIGLMASLAHLGLAKPGKHLIDTPAGTIAVTLDEDGHSSTIENVPSYRFKSQLCIDVKGLGLITGDIAWGGNWFFLVEEPEIPLVLGCAALLSERAKLIKTALLEQGIRAKNQEEIDHIEFFQPSHKAGIDARNFVLCPGDSYDRSPCGTGTSAKVACLYADQKLKAGQRWRQEGITGSVFEAWIEEREGLIYPSIKGEAYVTSAATLYFNKSDPCRWGF